MAFCNNCGHELEDGVKFCSNCGASTENGMVPRSSLGNETVENRSLPQTEYEPNTTVTNTKPVKKKSGRLFAFLLFIAAFIIFMMDISILQALLSVGIIVAGVYFFKQGYKFKVFTVLAMLIAVISILGWVTELGSKKSDDDMYAYSTEETERPASSSSRNSQTSDTVTKSEPEDKTEAEPEVVIEKETQETNTPVETTVTEEKSAEPAQETAPANEEQAEAEPEEKQADSDNVLDPDLKAFLDSYEAFIDEYVEFMKKYQSDTTNTVAMLNDYTNIMNRYADFAEKIEKYDTETMSKADLEYYLDVTNRCSKKMLSVY